MSDAAGHRVPRGAATGDAGAEGAGDARAGRADAGGPALPAGAGGELPDFEHALERLERVVAELERGELSLERALVLFEEGVSLARLCAARLHEAEQRIRWLVDQHGEILLLQAPELEAQDGADPAGPAGGSSAPEGGGPTARRVAAGAAGPDHGR